MAFYAIKKLHKTPWKFCCFYAIIKDIIDERMVSLMKRLFAVLMSLLLCVSVLTGPVYGCCYKEPTPPTVEELEGDEYPISPLDDEPNRGSDSL